jgi:hypothetical protein
MSLIDRKLEDLKQVEKDNDLIFHKIKKEQYKTIIKENFPSLRDTPYNGVCFPWHDWHFDMKIGDDDVVVLCKKCGQVKYNAQFYMQEYHDSILGYINVNDPKNKLTPYIPERERVW